MSGLVSCTQYHFRAHSKQLDPNGEVRLAANDATSADQPLVTTGCTGSAAASSTSSGLITTAAGGTLSFGSNTLTVPTAFTGAGSHAYFQAKQLDPTAFFTAAGTPAGELKVGNSAYNLEALTDTLAHV